MFTLDVSKHRVSTVICCFNFSNEADGFWSQEGVVTEVTFFDEEKKTYDVICTSDHLTSFAVMLDVNMALSVSLYTFQGGGGGGGGGVPFD